MRALLAGAARGRPDQPTIPTSASAAPTRWHRWSKRRSAASCGSDAWLRVARRLVVILDQISKAVDRVTGIDPPRDIEVTAFFNLVGAGTGASASACSAPTAPAPLWLHWPPRRDLARLVLLGLAVPDHRLAASAALGLVVGGALGNVIDRLRLGAVFDFLDFHLARLSLAGLQSGRFGDHRRCRAAALPRVVRPRGNA